MSLSLFYTHFTSVISLQITGLVTVILHLGVLVKYTLQDLCCELIKTVLNGSLAKIVTNKLGFDDFTVGLFNVAFSAGAAGYFKWKGNLQSCNCKYFHIFDVFCGILWGSIVPQVCPFSVFLSKFLFVMTMVIALSSCVNGVTSICSYTYLSEQEFADDVVHLSEGSDKLCESLHHIATFQRLVNHFLGSWLIHPRVWFPQRHYWVNWVLVFYWAMVYDMKYCCVCRRSNDCSSIWVFGLAFGCRSEIKFP